MNRSKLSFLSLIAVVWFFASGSALAATECSGPITGTVHGGVVVNGGTCQLLGAHVTGGVRVAGGTSFVVICGSTINGGFTSDGAGELLIGAEEIGCKGNVFNGAILISNTGSGLAPPPAPSIALENSTINGAVSLTGNLGPISVAGNRISGRLFCSNNVQPLDDEGMTNVISGQVSCTFK